MSYEPLHHKYRPATFADLVGQEAIAATLTSAIRQQKIAPAYLFAGPRGTGKTSSARILAKSLNCLEREVPTEQPCGVCQACRTIALGSALDTIEIDAASNTGVDNIRDLIERAQFAPVQCRYKLYIIDECLAGNSQILTEEGSLRIDNPKLKGKKVLSYNESLKKWEYKQVLRWLKRGTKPTSIVQTDIRTLQCTANHWMRSDRGWIQAKDLQLGTQILSPLPVFETPSCLQTAVGNATTGHSMPTLVRQERLDCPPQSRPQWQTHLESVTSIRAGEPVDVYDLEVEDNHNFVANGLLVHNCHMLSTAAFNALLKTLEEPPDRVVFVLATTDPQRVLPTIISRCQRFDFRRIPIAAMVAHLQTIARQEAIDIDDEAIALVAQIAQGGLRDAQSLLDQLGLFDDRVTLDRVWDLVGAVPERDLMSLLEAIANDNPQTVLERVRHLMDRGREPPIVVQNLAGFYRDLLIAKTAPDRRDLVALTPQTWDALCQFAQQWSMELILTGAQHLRGCEGQIKSTTQPRLWLEVALLGLLPSALMPPAASLPAAYIPPAQFSPPTPTPPARNLPQQAKNPPSPPPTAEPPTPASLPEESFTPNPTPQPDPPPTGNVSPEAVWAAMLDNIPRLATRELLRQQGQLSYFDGAVAKIALSPGLIKIASSKIEEIKQAFFKVCHGPLEVRLESNVATAATTTPTQSSAVYREARSVPASSAPPERVAKPIPVAPPQPPATSSTPVQSSEPPPTSELGRSEIGRVPTAMWEEDEVDIAARQLAELFQGEVISNLYDSELEASSETEEVLTDAE